MISFSAAAAMKLSGTVVDRLALPLASTRLKMMPGEPKMLVGAAFRITRWVLRKTALAGSGEKKLLKLKFSSKIWPFWSTNRRTSWPLTKPRPNTSSWPTGVGVVGVGWPTVTVTVGALTVLGLASGLVTEAVMVCAPVWVAVTGMVNTWL